MPLEDMTGPNVFIDAFNITWPLGSDTPTEGDDHIRGVKNCTTNWAAGYDASNLKEQVDAAISSNRILPVAQAFSVSGTYTPDPNLVYAIIELVGGGGGGGGTIGLTENSLAGGGGGGGGYATHTLSANQFGPTEVITIGIGGTASTGNSGSGGTPTSLGALVSANGGSGGGIATSGAFGAAGIGGAGTGGLLQASGAPGGPGAWFSSHGAITSVGTHTGGSSIWGGGGLCVVAPNGGALNGENGVLWGGGGSGGMSNFIAVNTAGGLGAGGYMLITEYITVPSP